MRRRKWLWACAEWFAERPPEDVVLAVFSMLSDQRTDNIEGPACREWPESCWTKRGDAIESHALRADLADSTFCIAENVTAILGVDVPVKHVRGKSDRAA